MKLNTKRMTALILVLLMTSSLLASCTKGEPEVAVTEVDGIPVYDKYASREIDLGLTRDETILNVIEVDGEIRATIGVDEKTYLPESDETIPYRTEHRYYSMDYVEDTTKREKTAAYHEVAFVSDPTVDFVVGGEPFEDKYGRGAQYHFYRDGKMEEDVLFPPKDEEDSTEWSAAYGVLTSIMLYENVPFVDIAGGTTSRDTFYRSGSMLYVNDRFLDTDRWIPGYPYYTYCGLIGIDGIPYGLLEIDEKGYLVPLTPETTELPMEGTEIEGCPTGGAFTDGRFGYFLSNAELWRTDGKKSQCIADLVPHGVTKTSAVRAVSALSDGRLLVVTDGKLVELSNADDDQAGGVKIYNIGVLNFYGDSESIKEFELLVSRYNDQAENTFFRVKEFDEKAKLNLALLSGEVAMVITPNRHTLKNYIKQNLLASLEEVAPDLFEKDVLIESVVNATLVDGTCYYLPVNFDICGEAIYDPGLLKEGKVFETREEYYDYINAHDPEYFKYKLPSEVLSTFTKNLDEWIEWETNTCHFDDGSFEVMLEFCAQGSTWEETRENFAKLLATTSLWARFYTAESFVLEDIVESYRFTDVEKAVEYQKKLPKVEGPTEDPTAWVQVDFPMPSKVYDGYEIDAHNLYAVVDNEDSRDAAADFLQWLILEDMLTEYPENEIDLVYGTGWDGFPINKEETDRYLRRLLNTYVDLDEKIATYSEKAQKDPTIVESIRKHVNRHNMKCSQEQYETTWEYINNADHLQYHKTEIHQVINEEAGRYFGGMITAKQAAEYIQNRISLYLAEQG